MTIKDAKRAGFKVHYGDDGTGTLGWWWTLYQDGWSGIECGSTQTSKAEAWADAVKTLAADASLQNYRKEAG